LAKAKSTLKGGAMEEPVLVKIIVYKKDERYWAVTVLPGKLESDPPNIVFYVQGMVPPKTFSQLRAEARKEARARGIPYVHKLDRK
jgi:hypothetical protein